MLWQRHRRRRETALAAAGRAPKPGARHGAEATAIGSCPRGWRPDARQPDAAATMAEVPNRIGGLAPDLHGKAQVATERRAHLLSACEIDDPGVRVMPRAAAP